MSSQQGSSQQDLSYSHPNDTSHKTNEIPSPDQHTQANTDAFTINDPNALVTVIIPVYNAAQTLEQALNSVQNQTHQNLEILCINDGSTDNSPDLMRAHAAADDRIVIIDKENQGYGASCNCGIENASGEWIAILEPDDWIEPDMYHDMLEFAAGFSEPIDLIKSPYWRIVDADTPHQKKLACSYARRIHPRKQPFVVTDAIHLLHHHPSIWSAIYRKRFLDEYHIRFEPIPGAGWADNPFLIETLCQAQNILYVDKAYYCYRDDTPEKASEFHRNTPEIPFDRWNEMLDIIERLGITDEQILLAHYSRGFMYMSAVIEEHDLDEPRIHNQLERMFKRMDPDLVFGYSLLSPGWKRLYAEICNIPTPRINPIPYDLNLIEQAFYNIRNLGIKETFNSVTWYLSTHRRRTGADKLEK